MWFTIGYTAACVACVYFNISLWFGIVGLVAAAALFFLRKRPAQLGAILLLGFFVGSCWFWGYNTLYLQSARQYDGEKVRADVTASDYSFETDYGVAVDGDLRLEGKRYHVRVYLTEIDRVCPGDSISGSFRLRLTTSDSLQGATFHQGDGIFLLAYAADDAQVTLAEHIPTKYFPAELRQRLVEILAQVFPKDVLGFAQALLLGDSSGLTYAQDTSFKVSGIRHVIAVSGLHISILLSMVYIISGKRRIPTALIGIPVLFLFAAVAGFTPSVVRACIMQTLMILALFLNKEYDPPTALSFAVLSMLTVNPLTITSVSFQLSVGCLVGIFLLYQPINTFLLMRMGQPKGMSLRSRIVRWIAGSVSVTLSAMFATTPISAFYFGAVSVFGVVTNLLTLWVISFVFCGIALACVLGCIWLPVAKVVAWIVSWPIRYVLLVARLISGLSVAAVYTCSVYIVLWLVFSYVLLTVFVLSRKKRAGVLALCALAGLLISVGASHIEPKLDHYRVTVFDVGQGQCILIQCGGENYLVDCGGDNDEMVADMAAEQLLSQGIISLDGLILTHYDRDHAGAADLLLSRIPAEMLYLPDIENDNSIRLNLEENHGDRICWVSDLRKITGSAMEISLLPAEEADKGNESCQSVLFQTKDCDILITGDCGVGAEKALLERTELPQLELLVVGHHGSASSTGFDLLKATKPAAAVISVGKDNVHGHPSYETLFRLGLIGCTVWRTDMDGTVTFRG